MSAHLHLTLFGKLQISLADRPVTGFVSSKAPALLCYLAATGRPHSRETLAALLWGDMSDVEAKANLRNALSNLRKLVGDYVQADRESVSLKSPYRLDVAEFEQLLDVRDWGLDQSLFQSPISGLQAAISCYQGDFLEGFTVRDALEFEEWMVAQRERLRQLALQAMFDLSLQLGEQGDYGAATSHISRLLTLEPWHEEGHRQMMILLARTGRRSEALAQFESCRRILAHELGIEPSAETTSLYHRLKAAGEPPPHNLPLQATPFVGRQAELARLAAHLSNPNCRLVTLTGPGGIGKSRLALQAATRSLPEGLFPDGLFWVALAPDTGITESGADHNQLLAGAIVAALSITPVSPLDPQRDLLNYLQAKEILLILDNLDSDPSGERLVAWLVKLLQVAPRVKLIITSRDRLDLQEEWLLEVNGLEYPPAEWSLERLPNYSAIALFIQQARQVQPQFSLTAADAPYVMQICRMVEGLPLALELAAGWLRVSTCAEIAAEIERGLDFLSTSLRNVPERHRSLRAMFDHTWQLLLEQEQVALRRLSVFRGGFKRDAAWQVASAGLPLLAALVNKSLLRMSAAGRYEIHELVRQYAAEHLAALPAEQDAVFDRHARYYADFLQQWRKNFERDPSPDLLEQLNAETANLRWGWQRAIEPGSTITANEYWYLGHYDQARYLAPSASGEFRPPTPDWDQGQALHRQGLQAYYQGDYPVARQRFLAALPLFFVAEDAVFTARAQVMLGQLAYLAGDDVEAERLLRQGVVGLKAAGDHRYRSYVLVNLAQITGQIDQVKTALAESLVLSRNIGSDVTTAHVLKNIGRLELALGQVGEAKSLFEESLALFRARHEVWGIASTLPLLGQAAMGLGDTSAAEQIFKEALHLSLEHQFKPLLLETLVGLAETGLKYATFTPQVLIWLALAANHPAARRDTRERATVLLAAIEDEEMLAVAQQTAGQPGALSTIVSAILDK